MPLFSQEDIKMKVTKDMLISDILGCTTDIDAVVGVLQSFGMHCIGCALASGETLEQAAAMHGADIDDIVAKINQYC